MASTSATTYASTIRTKHLRELVEVAQGMHVASKFASKAKAERGAGDTVRWNKILRAARATTASTQGTLIVPANAQALTSNYKEASLENWGSSFAFDDDITSYISKPENQKVIAQQMNNTLDYQIMKKICVGCFRHRIDKDSTYIASGAATAASTTTSLVGDANMVTTSDDKNGGFVTITNPEGPGYDECSKITDCTTTTADTAAVTFTQKPTAASRYHLTVGTGVVATDVMTTTALMDASGRHELFQTEKFKGGLYRMFINPGQHRDLWDDTTFINSAIYDDSDRLENYRVGRWFDIEFLITSNAYREDVSGDEDLGDGVCIVAPVFGANAYNIVSFANPGGSGDFAVNWHIVDTPDSQNLRLSARYISWKGQWAGAVTRATSIIGLMGGETDMGITV